MILLKDYESLNQQVKRFKKENGFIDVDLPAFLSANDLESFRDYFQSQLNNLLKKPRGTSPIKVSRISPLVLLQYQYPSDEEYYNLEKDLENVRFLAEHIYEQVKIIENQKLHVTEIVLRADLAPKKSDLQYSAESPYKSEFGSSIDIVYSELNKESNQNISIENINITSGAINLEKLVILKLHSLRRYLNRQLEVTIKIPVKLELTTGNEDQLYIQSYSVVIKIKME